MPSSRRAYFVKSLGDGAFLGWCALCGRKVLASERHLRVRGLVFHERCAAFRRRRLSAGVLRVARLPIAALSLHGERAHKSRRGVLEATERELSNA